MMGDPKGLAAIIIGKMKGKGAEKSEPDDHDEGAGEMSGADAMKGLKKKLDAGDFEGAFAALKVAISYCQDDEDEE